LLTTQIDRVILEDQLKPAMAEIIAFLPRPRVPLQDRIAAMIRTASDDPVLGLIAEERYRQTLASAARLRKDPEEADRLDARTEALFEEIALTRATTIEGAVAQLRFLFTEPIEWVEIIAASLLDIAAEYRRRETMAPAQTVPED